MSYTPCWTCAQPATHVFTRAGSNTLYACDNCTRIDRSEAESRGWTIKPITENLPTPRPDEETEAEATHRKPSTVVEVAERDIPRDCSCTWQHRGTAYPETLWRVSLTCPHHRDIP